MNNQLMCFSKIINTYNHKTFPLLLPKKEVFLQKDKNKNK